MDSPLGEGEPDSRQHLIYSQLRTLENKEGGRESVVLYSEQVAGAY